MTKPLDTESIVRFWAHVDKTGDCWIWITAGTRWNGKPCYGTFRRAPGTGNTHPAHRVSWEIANGLIPKGLFVLHRCDNKRCVNPEHLFVGTRKENAQDMIAKRGPTWWKQGQLNSRELLRLRGYAS